MSYYNKYFWRHVFPDDYYHVLIKYHKRGFTIEQISKLFNDLNPNRIERVLCKYSKIKKHIKPQFTNINSLSISPNISIDILLNDHLKNPKSSIYRISYINNQNQSRVQLGLIQFFRNRSRTPVLCQCW